MKKLECAGFFMIGFIANAIFAALGVVNIGHLVRIGLINRRHFMHYLSILSILMFLIATTYLVISAVNFYKKHIK